MSIRLSGVVGSIVEAGLSPHPVDRYLELIDPMLTWREPRAQVITVDRPTDRTVRLLLRPNRHWKGHQAGQYIQLKVIIDGVKHTRCFSPANAETSGDIELTITAHDNGFVSRHLREHACAGDVYGLSHAAGDFLLPADIRSPVVLISGGSGVTPTLSILRTLVSQCYAKPITVVHYARTHADNPYRAELTALAAMHGNLDLHLHETRPAASGEGTGTTVRNGARIHFRPGHFRPEHLDTIANLDTADIFVCGPATLMDAVTGHVETAYPAARLHSESFRPPAPAPIDPNQPVSGDLTFTRSGAVATNDGRTILVQAEAAGLNPASGCRMGICFSCTAIKKSGSTRNVLTGDTDTEADKQIQLCINAPVGDVEIEV
ncbi:MAG: ferredoxin reductase [Gordonia sp. (in: high G+C Gram-positive bacteria)]